MEKMFRKVHLSMTVSAALTLAIGLLLTTLLFSAVRRSEVRLQEARFQREAALRINVVASGMGDAVEQLLVLNQLFRAMGDVSREQFAVYSAPLLARYPAIQALSFQRLLHDRDRARYEAQARQRLPTFQITEFVDGQRRPAARREQYNVVEYIEPWAGNESAFGLDTGRTNDQVGARERAPPGR